jgi:hypothetical protein
VLYKGNMAKDDTFYYPTKIQYYEKDGILFSTTERDEFEKYSGMTVNEFVKY